MKIDELKKAWKKLKEGNWEEASKHSILFMDGEIDEEGWRKAVNEVSSWLNKAIQEIREVDREIYRIRVSKECLIHLKSLFGTTGSPKEYQGIKLEYFPEEDLEGELFEVIYQGPAENMPLKKKSSEVV